MADYPVINNFLRGFFRRRAVRVVGGVALLVVVVVLLFLILNWQIAPTKPSQRKDLVLAVAQILGGTALLSGLYFTWRSLQVNREGQITERFTTAIDQLGKLDEQGDKVFEIRIGGVYALDRIARESEEDYWPIMDVLCAYVRKHAPRIWLPEVQEGARDLKEDKRSGGWFWGSREHEPADPDIQAIITVLRRRSLNVPSGPNSYLVIAPSQEAIRSLDLHETNLTNANFSLTNLRNAIFFGANLKGAWLWESNLTSAQLSRANLTGANLAGADLTWALLVEADLTRARLTGANLTGANLTGANLTGADLSRAELLEVRERDLTQEQLEQADGDEYTLLPYHLKPPSHWGVKTDEQTEGD